MTGYRSSFLRHKCLEKGCYIEQLPDWEDLIKQFPRNIRPTDVDGMVEINDHFLFLEEKCAGKGPDNGQRLALKKLSTRLRVTVIFFRPGGSQDFQVLLFHGGESKGWQDWSRHQFMAWVHAWAMAVDSVEAAAS